MFLSSEEKQKFFHTEFIKSGVEYHQAAEAARILVSDQPDDHFSDEQIQLVKEACKQWLSYRKRWHTISNALNTIQSVQKSNIRRPG